MEHTENPEKFIKKRVGRNVFDSAPKVSVIIPAYNSAAYISETLDSVMAQKFREFEIIVVNDGSPDTAAFERELTLHLENITYIRQRNAGAGVARNTGIENARAPVVAFLDADDIWLPDFLTSQYVYLGRYNYDMVYCDAQVFGLRSAYRKTFMETAPSEGEADFNGILDLRCNVITSGTVARKQAIVKAGMFENERVHAEDFHLWLRVAKTGGRIGYQRKPLLKYRVHADGLSGDSISRVERSLGAFRRVRDTIALDEGQAKIVESRISDFEADLAVEQGKAYLLRGEFKEAAVAFRVANRHRKSLRLRLIVMMTGFAPKTLLRYYKRHRAPDMALLPKS